MRPGPHPDLRRRPGDRFRTGTFRRRTLALTFITDAGTFVNGTHDHRIVVYATRIS